MPETDAQPLTGRRVLLCEDEMAVALSMAMLLESKGCDIVKVARYRQGLIHLDTAAPFDAAILDVSVADGPVYPLADALTACHIPFIFLTGYGIGHLPTEWRDRPILEKPMDTGELIDWLIRNIPDDS